jgi:hypothetical protein
MAASVPIASLLLLLALA